MGNNETVGKTIKNTKLISRIFTLQYITLYLSTACIIKCMMYQMNFPTTKNSREMGPDVPYTCLSFLHLNHNQRRGHAESAWGKKN